MIRFSHASAAKMPVRVGVMWHTLTPVNLGSVLASNAHTLLLAHLWNTHTAMQVQGGKKTGKKTLP